MAALLLGAGRSTRMRIALWAGAGAISILVGFSRIYLGVHCWTDVVGGSPWEDCASVFWASCFSGPGATPSQFRRPSATRALAHSAPDDLAASGFPRTKRPPGTLRKAGIHVVWR